MPTTRVKKRVERRFTEALDPSLEYELLMGEPLIDGFETKEDMADAWLTHRDELREKWAAEHPPWTRCHAEYLYELVGQFGERRLTDAWKPTHEANRSAIEFHGILDTHCWPPFQESEAEYLYRNNVIDQQEYEAALAAHS